MAILIALSIVLYWVNSTTKECTEYYNEGILLSELSNYKQNKCMNIYDNINRKKEEIKRIDDEFLYHITK